MTDPSTAAAAERVIVIGAGQAAAQLAISLRGGGFTGPLVVIGDEPFLPYQRPPLSKKFLSERPKPDSLFLRPEQFWSGRDVEFRLGTAVAKVDLSNRIVTLANGSELGYQKLAFATGTRARRLPLPGIDRANVFSLRSIGDVQRLRPMLDAAEHVAVLGGGYIGLETAAVMRGENRAVTVVEAEDRVLKRVTAPAVAAFFDRTHRQRGVEIRLGQRVEAIGGEGARLALNLTGGGSVAADVILLAAGAAANDELARASGLACRDGVVVDDHAQTAVENVYAIGDCARFPSRRYGRQLRLECVQNAIDQAKMAAAAMLGAPESYDPVPWFWSDQYEFKLQIAGLFDDHDAVAEVGDLAAGHFSVEYRKAGRLIAVDAVNDPRAHMLARRRIAAETGPEGSAEAAAAQSMQRQRHPA